MDDYVLDIYKQYCCNNIWIDIYEHQINIHICLWITVIPAPFPPQHTLALLAALINCLCLQSSALQSTGGLYCLVGRACNQSKVTLWQCGVFIQVLAFLVDEQSAQGWRTSKRQPFGSAEQLRSTLILGRLPAVCFLASSLSISILLVLPAPPFLFHVHGQGTPRSKARWCLLKSSMCAPVSPRVWRLHGTLPL